MALVLYPTDQKQVSQSIISGLKRWYSAPCGRFYSPSSPSKSDQVSKGRGRFDPLLWRVLNSLKVSRTAHILLRRAKICAATERKRHLYFPSVDGVYMSLCSCIQKARISTYVTTLSLSAGPTVCYLGFMKGGDIPCIVLLNSVWFTGPTARLGTSSDATRGRLRLPSGSAVC